MEGFLTWIEHIFWKGMFQIIKDNQNTIVCSNQSFSSFASEFIGNFSFALLNYTPLHDTSIHQFLALGIFFIQLPARVALTGDVMHVKDKKVNFFISRDQTSDLSWYLIIFFFIFPQVQTVLDSLNKSVSREHEIASRFSHSVSAILTSAGPNCKSRSEGLQNILNQIHLYNLYKFDIGYVILHRHTYWLFY